MRRMAALAAARPSLIILREKDLSPAEYASLAARCREICAGEGAPLAANSQLAAARSAGLTRVHLPLAMLRQGRPAGFAVVGASVHAPQEAAEAVRLGADYLIAGHIFATGCKPGQPPRGLGFLREVCAAAADRPVYAIGGMTPERVGPVLQAGARGVCVMSGFMCCDDPAALAEEFWAALRAGAPLWQRDAAIY